MMERENTFAAMGESRAALPPSSNGNLKWSVRVNHSAAIRTAFGTYVGWDQCRWWCNVKPAKFEDELRATASGRVGIRKPKNRNGGYRTVKVDVGDDIVVLPFRITVNGPTPDTFKLLQQLAATAIVHLNYVELGVEFLTRNAREARCLHEFLRHHQIQRWLRPEFHEPTRQMSFVDVPFARITRDNNGAYTGERCKRGVNISNYLRAGQDHDDPPHKPMWAKMVAGRRCCARMEFRVFGGREIRHFFGISKPEDLLSIDTLEILRRSFILEDVDRKALGRAWRRRSKAKRDDIDAFIGDRDVRAGQMILRSECLAQHHDGRENRPISEEPDTSWSVQSARSYLRTQSWCRMEKVFRRLDTAPFLRPLYLRGNIPDSPYPHEPHRSVPRRD